ncbi:tRNA-aminoacylation cofactor ARC1 [Candida viswanathii]|jgi:aminoacyl tRNA synthase complex-interacting multifunctional protein 1|uniref:tRNA-aminoacylation cofactor ARC1 n=1 Tax=Candida viswanathii TaxID=5486 RepID=A0A367Y962_9ASCO|nr:tRNA-aminoacylation cofactor ARC1 [Candida viswanathii]
MSDFIAKFSKISLADVPSADASKFPELTTEQKALASQFETLSKRLDEKDTLVELNDSLRTKTFIAGNVPSTSDLTVFEKVYPLASKWTSKEDVAKFRHILRWVDLVQNTLVTVPEPIKIDYDIEIPREIKEKKKPAAAGKEGEKSATPEPQGKKNDKAAPAEGQRKELTEEEKKARAAAKEAKKAAKAKANAEKNKPAAAVPPNPSMIDFRVGFIQKAEKHPNADSLYMSTIDMGDEEGPRIVCSGLVKYIPIEEMQKRYVVVVANLKSVTMRGVKSCAMVLCASDADKVEFVNPPAGSKPGDKIFFEDFNGTPEKQLNPKKKIWETVQPHFSTTENFEVTYTEEGKEPKRLVNEKGELCKNSSIVKADVK